jgi:hypothetical protein
VAVKRIKSTWHQSDRNATSEKTLEDNAGALAFITWRVALETAKDLHREGYHYESDQQRVSVIAELVAFLVQVADRLAYDSLDDDDRHTFVNALARRLGDQIQDNLTDLFGPGDYRSPFIETLNERLSEYADLSFSDGKPGYDFLRYLGSRVVAIMGDDQTNRWVIDQIMDISGPEAVSQVSKSMGNLFSGPA